MNEAFRRFSTADWIVAGTALFIICNGVSVCIGWWVHIPILVQLPPDAPTHFNTALIFVLLGVGELGLVLRRRGVVLAMAVVVTCIASAELAEYALGLNLGIDTLFAAPFVGFDARYPGRMSGNTIAGFLLVCAAQVLMSKPDHPDTAAATTAAVILKTLAGGIAFLAMLGYVVGLKSAYGWTDAVGMSIRSCAGFLLIFIARIAALWQRDIVDKPSLPNWFLPFLAISVVTISISLIWIFASPAARPFMLDPLYAGVAHRRSIAVLLSIGTLLVLGTISVLVARQKAVTARVSEKKLFSVLEHMSEGVILIDAKGNAFYQNPAFLRIHGFEPNGADFIKTLDFPSTWKGWDENGRALHLDEWPLSRVIRGERVQNQVLRARRCDITHELFASYNGSPIYDDDGKIALSFITIQDITERRQAEREVRESEERFRTLANSIPQLAWMARADGFLFWYNQRWHDYTGTTPEQMEGSGWQSVHDPAVLPTVVSRWRDAIALAQPFEMEFPLRGVDGTFRNFLARGQPMYDSEGRLVQWFGTCTDVDQLKRVERSLRVTQARLESTLKASSVGTWTWHLASDRLIADECTARMFSIAAGAAAEGLPVAAYLQIVHEEDRKDVADALERAIELCGAYDIEYRVRQGDGAFRWLQARGRVESDGAGRAVYFHGAVIDVTDRKLSELSLRDGASRLEETNRELQRDITERKRVESALQKSELRYHTLFSTMDEGFCVIEVIFSPEGKAIDFRYLEVNPAFYKQTGMHDMVGKRMREIYPVQDDYWFELYGKIVMTGEPAHVFNEARALSGFYDIHAYRIGDPELRQVAIISNDISELKLLDEARSRLAAIVESSDDAIVGKDLCGIVTSWNAGAEKLFGYAASEIIGQSIRRIIPSDHSEEEEMILGRIAQGETVNHLETVRLCKDGKLVNVSVTESPITDDQGTIVGASKIARDSTERYQQLLARDAAALALRDKNQELERSNRDLEDFAYIASHDLKTPLSGIKSVALWLEEDLHDLSDESRKLLGLMRSRINRMETLLDDLLAFSRVGRTDTAVSETKLSDIFASMMEVLNPPAHIQVRVEGELPVIVTASAQLEQVLRNLIGNAIKHHDKQVGEVVLSAKRVGDFVEFMVRDDGPGILPKFHEKIFQLFQTLKRRDEVESTGMGLTIVKKLVERQNCRITVHSQGNGTGTEFRFRWPISSVTVYAEEPTNA
ncbi:MAG: PAS domain S-box protein [Steroidobacteraceae bacterium]